MENRVEGRRTRLEEELRDLLSNVLGRLFWDLGLLYRRNTGDEIHLLGFPGLCTLEELPAEEQKGEEGNVNVGGEES